MSTQSTITANLAVTREKRSHLSFPLLENIMWHADFLERKCDICTVAIVEIFKLDVSLIIIDNPTSQGNPIGAGREGSRFFFKSVNI